MNRADRDLLIDIIVSFLATHPDLYCPLRGTLERAVKQLRRQSVW